MKEFTRRFLTLFVIVIMIFVAWKAVFMMIDIDERPREKYIDIGPGLHIDLNIKENEEHDWEGKSLTYNAYFPDHSDKRNVKFLSKNICVEQSPYELKIGKKTIDYPNTVNANVKGTKISYQNIYDGITMEYCMGLETLKKSFIIHKFPNTLKLFNDLTFSTKMEIIKNGGPFEDFSIEVDGLPQTGNFTTSSSIEFRDSDRKVIFSIPQSYMEDSPDYVWSSYESKYLPDFGTIDKAPCKFKVRREDNILYIDLIVPNSFLLNENTRYPVFIDPSISPNPVDVMVSYQGLYNGTILRIEGNNKTYYENVSNTLIQDSNLTITSSGSLTLDNIILKMNCTYDGEFKIDIFGEFNIKDSIITNCTNPNKYDIYFQPDSQGLISNSMIEMCGYTDVYGNDAGSGGVAIYSSNIKIKNSIIQKGDDKGIVIYQATPEISDNTIKDFINDGIYGSSAYPTILDNEIYNCTTGIRWENNMWNDSYDTSEKINLSENIRIINGYVELDNKMSETGFFITEDIQILSNAVWKNIWVTKSEPNDDTLISLSVIDPKTSEIIPKYTNLTSSSIDLSKLDPGQYPKIRIRVDLFGNGSIFSTPYLYDLSIQFPVEYLWEDSFSDWSLISDYSNVRLIDGAAELDLDVLISENCNDNNLSSYWNKTGWAQSSSFEEEDYVWNITMNGSDTQDSFVFHFVNDTEFENGTYDITGKARYIPMNTSSFYLPFFGFNNTYPYFTNYTSNWTKFKILLYPEDIYSGITNFTYNESQSYTWFKYNITVVISNSSLVYRNITVIDENNDNVTVINATWEDKNTGSSGWGIENNHSNGYSIGKYILDDMIVTHGYHIYGNLTSDLISTENHGNFNSIYINKTEPDENHYITIDILNGSTNEVIPGYNNLTSTHINISSLKDYPSLKLRAEFYGNKSVTEQAKLNRWQVGIFTTIGGNEISGNLVGIYINASSPTIKDNNLENAVNVICRYSTSKILENYITKLNSNKSRFTLDDINNSSKGIFSHRSCLIMSNNTILDSKYGIYLNYSSGIENNTLPIFNFDRDITFTTGDPPSYDGDKITYLNVPNFKNTIITNATVELEGKLATYYGYDWNSIDSEISNDPGPAYYPQEISPNMVTEGGNIYVVWEDYRSDNITQNNADIYFNMYDGTSWNDEDVKISNGPLDTNQTNPVVAVENGNIYVTWEDYRGGALAGYDIYFNMYNGSAWQDTDTKISNGGSYTNQQRPTITVNNSIIYVAWDDDRNEDSDIYLNKYDGISWQDTDTKISNGPTYTYQNYPSISAENGKVYVVWEDDRNGDYDIYYNYYNGSAWGSIDEKVSHDPIFNNWANQFTPSIAVYNGNISVAWTDWRNVSIITGIGDSDIYYNQNTSNSWENNDIKIDNGPTNTNQSFPSIAVDNDKKYVAWNDDRNLIGFDIYLNKNTSGSWGNSDIRITDPFVSLFYIADTPGIAADNNNAYIAWQDWRNGDADIYFNKSVSGSWDNDNTLISNDWGSNPPTNQTNPSIASENGNIYVVWEDDRDGDYDIYFNKFNGSSWNNEDERISNGTIGTNQKDPELAVYNGKIAVVWEDDRGGHSKPFDIVANIYNGSSWQSTDERVDNSPGFTNQLNPTVSYKNNEIYVAWEDWRDESKSEIYFNKHSSGSWGNNDINISHGILGYNQTNPQITADNSGNIYVAWEHKSNYFIIGGKLPLGSVSFGEYTNGDWSQEDIKISTDSAVASPDISTSNGKIYVCWEDNRDVYNTDIYFNESVNGIWGAVDIKINHEPDSPSNANQSNPSITSDSNNIYIVWVDDREGNDIYYNIREGSEWRDYDTEISHDPGYSTQNLPTIAIYNDEIYVAWEDNRDGDYNIYYNDYQERYLTSYPENPTLDVGADGDIEWNYNGEFAIKRKVQDFSDELESYLNNHKSEEDMVTVPLKFNSDTVGKINVSSIKLFYEIRPYIDNNFINNCSFGIFSVNYSTPIVHANTIAKSTNDGIHLNTGKLISNQNSIYSNNVGINSTSGILNLIDSILANNEMGIISIASTYIITGSDFYNNNLTSLKVIDSALMIATSSIINSKTSFDGIESDIVVDNCTINSTNFDFKIKDDSHAVLINTSHDQDKLSIINQSDLSVNWYLHVRLLHENETGVDGGYISIYNNSYTIFPPPIIPPILRNDFITDTNGYVNWILCNEYIIESNDFRVYDTPHTIQVGDNNLVTIPMDISKTVKLYYGKDTDLDKIYDTIENKGNTLWFEAEHHIRKPDQIISYENYGDASNFQTVERQANSKHIINNTFPLALSGLGTYQCFIRAKIANSPSYENISINISIYENDTLLVDSDKHFITPKYEWYSTPSFKPHIKYVRLVIDDLDSGTENIYVDKVMLVRIKNNDDVDTYSNVGQTTDPLDPDTERDQIIDGLEVRTNTYWYEAEDYIYNTSNQIKDDINASNAKTAIHDFGIRNITQITTLLIPTLNSKYRYYIKARNNTINPNSFINVSVDNGTYIYYFEFKLTDKYEWYSTSEIIPNFPFDSGNLTIIVFDDTDPNLIDNYPYAYVDKIMLVDISEIFVDKFSDSSFKKTVNVTSYGYNNSASLKIPYDATATTATIDIWGTTSSKYVPESGVCHNPASYNDKIVYEKSGEIFIYYTSTGNEYGITSGFGVNPSTPSIHENKIVWSDYRNGDDPDANPDIYMYDLGPDGEFGTIDDGEMGGYQITIDPPAIYYHQLCPDIWGDYIVWENHSMEPSNVNIHFYDLSADTDYDGIPNYQEQDRPNRDPAELNITDDQNSQYNPSISENRIVWADDRNGPWDIYMYDLSIVIEKYNSYKERRMTTNIYNQRCPDIYGDRIVWQDDRSDDWEIYLYDLLTETELKLYGCSNKDEVSPAIFGDKVTWGHQEGLGNSDIYAYDLSVDSDWDGVPNYLENPTPLNDPALLMISTNNSNQNNPAIGGDIIVWEVSDDIYYCYQSYTLDVGNDGDSDWHHNELFTIPEATQNFAGEINEYLEEHQQDIIDGFIYVPLNFSSETEGKIKLTNLTIDLEFLIDPIDIDTDSDNLNDGNEIFRFFGYDILEMEDAIQIKEWIPSYLELVSIHQQGLVEFKLDTSTTMHQTYVTLVSSRNLTKKEDKPEGYRDSWIKLRTHINETGLYKFKIDPKLNDGEDLGFEIKEDTSLWAYKYVGNAEYYTYYPVKLSTMGEHIQINKTIADYIRKIIANATYISIERSGTEVIEPINKSVISTASISKVQMGTSIDGISTGNIAVDADWVYTAEYKLSQHTDYMIVIGLNLELVPPELLPEFKNNPNIDSEVPDNLPWENITFIKLDNLDCIRVERQTLNPLTIDADKDGLSDGFEANDTLFPLNADADGDGLNDYIEMFESGTNFAYRDTDLDGIRDGVELGYTQSEIEASHGEIKSPGSWIERIAHYNTPYEYTPINNWDADNGNTVTDPFDTDTDDDFLPDGWTDGWYYRPSPIDPSSSRTYHTNNNRYKDVNNWRYDEKYWGIKNALDNIVQIYEGEDLNLDGKQNQDISGWGFDNMTFTRKDTTGETSPISDDTDSDDIPDGYEVWYSHLEPYFYLNTTSNQYEYILNPTEWGDKYFDKDVIETSFVSYGPSPSTKYFGNYKALAQRISIPAGYNFGNISKISIHLNLYNALKARGEIWYGDPNAQESQRTPIGLITYLDNCILEDNGWYSFDIPDSVFDIYSELDMGGIDYYIVIRYIDETYGWTYQVESVKRAFGQTSSGGWNTLESPYTKFDYRLYTFDFDNAGDNLTNLGEYIVGTNPKNNNSDTIKIGNKQYSDNLEDGTEVGYQINDTLSSNPNPKGGIIFRTNINDGALKFNNYDNSSAWIQYDGDGNGTTINTGHYYNYSCTQINPKASEPSTSKENILLFILEDGTKIYLSPESGHNKLYIWKPGVNLENYKTDTNDIKYLEGKCIVFNKTVTVDMSNLTLDVNYRNQEFYVSDPFNYDTDSDGIKDGNEINWRDESEISALDPDTIINVRDSDSDNDGIEDGRELNWSEDFEIDTDSIVNMIDPDSDGDGLYDGDEPSWWADTDRDGAKDMLDKDSDDDELDDGPEVEPYKKDNSSDMESVELITNLKTPKGIDIDYSGNIFFIENEYPTGTESIKIISKEYDEIEPIDNSANVHELLSSNYLFDPHDLVVDREGNIYYTEDQPSGNDYLKMLPYGYNVSNPSENAETIKILLNSSIGGISDPKGIAIDGNGNIFYTSYNSLKMLPTGYNLNNTTANAENVKTLLSGVSNIHGLSIDTMGNLYFTIESASGSICKLNSDYAIDNSSKNYYKTLLANLNSPQDIDIDASYNIYFTCGDDVTLIPSSYFENYPSLNIKKIITVISTSNSYYPEYLTVNGRGDVFFTVKGVGETTYQRVEKIRTTRTSPILNDTDFDGLWDGYNITINGDVKHPGELDKHHVYQTGNETYQLESDSDFDGLLDGQEVAGIFVENDGDDYWKGWCIQVQYVSSGCYEQGTNHLQNVSSDPMDNDGDTDNDGISDYLEYRYTDPTTNDTDADGLNDTTEDKNKNGRLDAEETSPIDRDTDDDRLPDGNMSISNYWVGEDRDLDGIINSSCESDPLNSDTDGDMVPDGNEYYYENANDVITRYSDSDGDGLMDILEHDSDYDGLDDGVENWDLDDELDEGELQYYTGGTQSGKIESDPTNPDCDGDGLLDGAEPMGFIDLDRDGFINIWDQDSNIIGNTAPEGSRDYDDVFVIFRTDAEDDKTLADNGSYIGEGPDSKLDYVQNTEIAVLYNKIYHKLYSDGYWYDQNNDNKTTPHGPGDWQITNIYRYKYSSDQSNPNENELHNISLNYTEFPSEYDIPILEDDNGDPIITKYLDVKTPEGYNVYLEDANGQPESTDNIIIELINESIYVRFEPYSMGTINTSIHSIPKSTPFEPNYVGKHQEFYDPRLALNMDLDFDGISNTEELLFGTNPYDADTDNDGIIDGAEINWNLDVDGDGSLIYVQYNDTFGCHNITYNSGINALDYDSDDDGIWDGVEFGLTDVMHKTHSKDNITNNHINWTDNETIDPPNYDFDLKFKADEDPTTITNMSNEDTDFDDLDDGAEDSNNNGKVDSNEPNPRDADSDDDGAADGHAKEGVDDSDEDGIKNCLDYDSDNDGVFDGTELGVTTPIPETDEIKGTDIDSSHFVIDSDPSTTTDPTEPDDDGDHLLDGLEDKNHNGAFDDGETDPLEVDTDGDGLYDGSEENQYGYSGEDSNDNGVVDTDESDPQKKDTDGDGLWDGDEVDPQHIDYDKYNNRVKAGYWYSSEPYNVDTDDDGLNDNQEIIGWDVRIFWEATLETVKGPYGVFSDPDVKDTDDDGLKDDLEFAYGADPDEDDTDDDNVDDDVEVERGDNPCGIEGRPPEITKLEVSAAPVVDDYQGTPYLKGWDVTVSITTEDSAGPYKFKLKALGGLPVEVELQEEKEDGYYKTEIDGSATVYVENDGSWDYCSAFITSTEDSVGNVLGTYIVGNGLPQYSNNILNIINNGEDAVKYKRDVTGVEYESVPRDVMNVEIINWLAEKIIEKIQYIIERIKIDADDYNKSKIVQFAFGSSDRINENTDEILDFIDNFNWTYGVHNEGKTRGKLAGYYTYDEALDYLISLADLIIEYDYSQNRNLCNFLYVHFLELFEENLYIDKDEDGLTLIWEKIYGTSDENSPDYDGDGLLDGEEFVVTFRTNVMNGRYDVDDFSNYISVQFDPWKPGIGQLWQCNYFNTEDYLYKVGDKIFFCGRWHIVTYKYFLGYTVEGYRIHMVKISLEERKDTYNVLISIEINKNNYAIYCNYNFDSCYPNPKASLREIIVRYTDPKDEDTDNDGLWDGWRNDNNHNNKWEDGEGYGEIGDPGEESSYYSGNKGSILSLLNGNRDEKPDPLVKDIYVEVDWMEPDIRTFYSWEDLYQFDEFGRPPDEIEYIYLSGIIVGYKGIWKHEFKVEAQNKVKKAFRDHNIVLHIDDGCMGGGEDIPHEDPNPNTDPNDLYYNPDPSIYIAKDGLHYLYENSFSDSRTDIFHYCVIAHYGVYNGQKRNADGGSLIGDYIRKGFVIFDGRINDPNVDSSIGKVFMHELGHNLGLDWYTFHGIDRDDIPISTYRSSMNYNAGGDIVDYSDGSRETDGNPSDAVGVDHNDWEDLNLAYFIT